MAAGASADIIGKSLGHKSQPATTIHARLNPMTVSIRSVSSAIGNASNSGGKSVEQTHRRGGDAAEKPLAKRRFVVPMLYPSFLNRKARMKIRAFWLFCGFWAPMFRGEGEIRTHGTLAGTTVFETVLFNRSSTSPYPAGEADRATNITTAARSMPAKS